MESRQARLRTFLDGVRIKFNKSKVLMKWPHPATHIATPETLSDAGFYFNPSLDDKDNVICFTCDKELSDWDAEDDPYQIHFDKCGRTCPWAIVRCGLDVDRDKRGRYRFDDARRIPTSQFMEDSRRQTFTDAWPHTSKKYGANPTQMAKAGFVYTPNDEAIDTATCFYCSTTLSNWEASDSPLEEHLSRKQPSKCAFVDHLEAGKRTANPPALPPSSSTTVEAPARPRTRKSIRASSRAPSPVESADESQAELARSTLGRSTRAQSKAPQSETEDVVEKPPAKPPGRTKKPVTRKSTARKSTARRSTMKKSIKANTPTPSASEAEHEEAPAALGRSTRGRPRAASQRQESITLAPDKPPAKTPAKRAPAKAKPNGRTASVALSETDHREDDDGRAALGRSTRKRAKTPVLEEDDVPEVVTVLASRKGGGRKTVKSQSPVEQDVDMDAPPTKARRPTRAASVARSVQDMHDSAEESAPAPTRKSRGERSVAPPQDDTSVDVAPTRKGRGRAASTAPQPKSEDETPVAKATNRPRARSVSRKPAPMSGVEEAAPPPVKGNGKGKSGRSRGRSGQSSATEEEEEIVTVAPAKTTTRRRAKSRGPSVAPSEVSDAAPAKPARRTRAVSRSRSIAPSERSDEEVPPARSRPPARERPLTPEESDADTAKRTRRPRARSRGPSVAPEPEPEAAPVRRTRARSRGPSAAPSDDEHAPTVPKSRKTREPSVHEEATPRVHSKPKVKQTKGATAGTRTSRATAAHNESVDELDLLRSAPAIQESGPRVRASRSTPSLSVVESPPPATKGKGKQKATSSKPRAKTSNVLKDAFASVKAEDDSEMDEDFSLRSPQPMTPAPSKVRLDTPDALSEDDTFNQQSSPSPRKPKRSHPHGQYFPSDTRDLTHADDDDTWEEERTILHSRSLAKSTPAQPSFGGKAQAAPHGASARSAPSAPSPPDHDNDLDLLDEYANDGSIITIGDEDETRRFKAQPKSSRPAEHIAKETATPHVSAINADQKPSSSKFIEPGSDQPQDARPPKLPTKQEAARAREVSEAEVQALRRLAASRPIKAVHIDFHAPSAPTVFGAEVASGPATGVPTAAAPTKTLGEGPTPKPLASVGAAFVKLGLHALPETLTEEERSMTVEQWIRKQSAIEQARFQRDTEEYIRAFERKAAETRAAMEAHLDSM